MTPRRFAIALILILGAIPPLLFVLTRDLAASPAGIPAACPVGFLLPGAQPAAVSFPLQPMPLWQQYLAVTTAFVIKPLYMLLSLVPIWLLRRAKSPDLVALWWCCFAFVMGEAFCAANYAAFGEKSYLMEYLHSLGMTIAFAAGAYAVAEIADARVLHFSSSQGCRLASLCGSCAEGDHPDACGVRRILRLGLPLLILIAAIPLTAGYHFDYYFSDIFGTRYLYDHPWPYQQYEIRFLPVAAMALFLGAWLAAGRERHPLRYTRILIAAGVGAVGFSFFRGALLAMFADDRVWFVAWEEITELAAILSVLALLYVFDLRPRRGARVDTY